MAPVQRAVVAAPGGAVLATPGVVASTGPRTDVMGAGPTTAPAWNAYAQPVPVREGVIVTTPLQPLPGYRRR